ncbi:MAG TPA: AAA family ATPase [Candidatus Saccharimonadales bacterium]|nr:AAA family ATPase [Candidatus Saccharimonadales bacterium]
MTRDLQVIGLSGTNGSGKDSLGMLLAERYGYWFISVTELLREECRKRGLPVARENLRAIGNELRRNFGAAVLVDKAHAAYQVRLDAGEQYRGLVMASLRNPIEADRVHELGGTVVWVDADPKVRYDRIQTNAAARGRAEEDAKTFDQFLAEETAEMHPPEGGDHAVLDMAAVKQRADIFVQNNSDDIETFAQGAAQALGMNATL